MIGNLGDQNLSLSYGDVFSFFFSYIVLREIYL